MTVSKSELIAELLEDYYAETDEHLSAVRRNLLALESFVGQLRTDPQLLGDLFRSFHTIKGLSGMVGLKEAEQLAHDTESYLKALQNNEVGLTSEAMDVLMASAGLLEQVIAAHRTKNPFPDITWIISRLAGLQDASSSASPSGKDTGSPSGVPVTSLEGQDANDTKGDHLEGKRWWGFQFVPDPTLALRGINVNNIRDRLKAIGELIDAKPNIGENGEISFEFTVDTKADESAFSSLKEDGVTFHLIQLSEQPEAIGAAGKAETLTTRKGPESKEAYHQLVQASVPFIASNFVRVEISKLDDLMRQVGELAVSRSILQDTLGVLREAIPVERWRAIQDTAFSMEKKLRELREGIMHVRMVPIGEIFERMRFAVRDLAREHRKEVSVLTHGEATEIDKLIVERMMDPLLHIVRNAVSHGLETEEERRDRGKPPQGTIKLGSTTVGDMVVIEVEDDGRGIDVEKVARTAKSHGIASSVQPVDNSDLLDIITQEGFTTLSEAGRTSGRGVGMSVVKKAVQELGGHLSMKTQQGAGTRFSISLPLTLSATDALIAGVGDQVFAVPIMSVLELIQIIPSTVTVFENNEIVPYRDGCLPLFRLGRLFGINESYTHHFYGLVTKTLAGLVAVAVDRLLGQKEIVLQGLNDPLLQVPGVSGAAVLGDSSIVLILDLQVLTRSTGKSMSENSKFEERLNDG